MLDVHTSEPHNYTEVNPPLLVRDEVMFGTAQLPKFRDDQFLTSKAAEIEDIQPIITQSAKEFMASKQIKTSSDVTPELRKEYHDFVKAKIQDYLGTDLKFGARNP